MKNTTEAKKEEMIREVRFILELLVRTIREYDPKNDYIEAKYDAGKLTIKTAEWSREWGNTLK